MVGRSESPPVSHVSHKIVSAVNSSRYAVDCVAVYTGGLINNLRMIRNKATDGPSCVFTAETPTYDQSKLVPVPVKKGNFEFDITHTQTRQMVLCGEIRCTGRNTLYPYGVI